MVIAVFGKIVFPAYAGVIPAGLAIDKMKLCVPRIRGGDPGNGDQRTNYS